MRGFFCFPRITSFRYSTPYFSLLLVGFWKLKRSSMDISAVNGLTYEQFVEKFGNVVEKCPLIPAAIWSNRPFSGIAEIQKHISDFIDSLPEPGKDGILRCHPDLAGREMQTGSLTRDSQAEQSAAGLTDLQPEETANMYHLNSDYKKLFGFPFVICARMNSKKDIMCQLRERLKNKQDAERLHAIEEVKKICNLRLHSLVLSDSTHMI